MFPEWEKLCWQNRSPRSIDCSFNRVQFTPDLLPSDITGVSIWDRQKSDFVFKPGAIFANIVLGDEINRASPKTQAALLEAMEEQQVTVDGANPPIAAAVHGRCHRDPPPTPTPTLAPIPLDRFMMKLVVGYPVRSKELEILETHGIRSTFEDLKPVVTGDQILEMTEVANHVHVAPSIQGYIVDLVEATRRHGELMLGASPAPR